MTGGLPRRVTSWLFRCRPRYDNRTSASVSQSVLVADANFRPQCIRFALNMMLLRYTSSSSSLDNKNGKDEFPSIHTPVLSKEVIDLWLPPPPISPHKDNEERLIHLVDGTVGMGGHSLLALRSHPSVRILAIDRDASALARAKKRLKNDDVHNRVTFHHGSYADIGLALRQTKGFPNRVDGILIDLGVNSVQLDDASRGFSFRQNGPLDMRFDRSFSTGSGDSGRKASDIVNHWSAQELADMFHQYGDEPMADVIADSIVQWRSFHKKGRGSGIQTTLELRFVIENAVQQTLQRRQRLALRSRTRGSNSDGLNSNTLSWYNNHNYPELVWRPDQRGRWINGQKRSKILQQFMETKPKHLLPLTRCFQALRIAVNQELEHLQSFLRPQNLAKLLKQDATLVMLSFHPDEDHLVKVAMERICASGSFELLTMESANDDTEAGEPIRPSKEETKRNRRSRTARLRSIKCIRAIE